MKGGKGILSRLSILFWLQNRTFLTARSYILFLLTHAARNYAELYVCACVLCFLLIVRYDMEILALAIPICIEDEDLNFVSPASFCVPILNVCIAHNFPFYPFLFSAFD